MFRGTTPTIQYALPFQADTLVAAWITISQSGQVIIEKSLSDFECKDNIIRCKLSQTDTLMLKDRTQAMCQLRVKTLDGTALATKQQKLQVSPILKEGEI